MELYLRHFLNQQTQELYCESENGWVGGSGVIWGKRSLLILI